MRQRSLSPAQRRRLAGALPEIGEGAKDELDEAVWTSTQRLLRRSFEKFDTFPKPVRRTLHETAVTFDPLPIARWIETEKAALRPGREISRFVCASIRRAEANDIREHAAVYQRKCGTDLPHLAAKARVLRYALETVLKTRKKSILAPRAPVSQRVGVDVSI